MIEAKRVTWPGAIAVVAMLAAAPAAETAAPKAKPKPAAPAQPAPPRLEPKAMEALKAMCDRLAAAKTMTFTTVATYESPSRLGPPLAYTTTSQVKLQRPDKLAVVTPGDGPASEFYYDGKIMMAYAPAENLVAVADAPPTIDNMLKALYDTAATYFPFTDFLVADPYKDFTDGLRTAFYIGQSRVVGGTTTDMIAIEGNGVFQQIWIGAEDKLPRMARAVFMNDPVRLRHQVAVSDWRIDGKIADDAFTSAKAATGQRMSFERPDARPPVAPQKQSGSTPAKKN